MEYDKVIEIDSDNILYKYGIINGNNIVFFIKPGQYGAIESNKYVKMAHEINELYGFTIVVTNNPSKEANPLARDMLVVDEYMKSIGIPNYSIYFMGYSNGATIGSLYGVKYPQIKRMLLVNTPIHSNTFANLDEFRGEFITFLYGSNDTGFKYVPYLFPYLNEKIGLEIIEGVDHKFIGKEDLFIELPTKYLFLDEERLKK